MLIYLHQNTAGCPPKQHGSLITTTLYFSINLRVYLQVLASSNVRCLVESPELCNNVQSGRYPVTLYVHSSSCCCAMNKASGHLPNVLRSIKTFSSQKPNITSCGQIGKMSSPQDTDTSPDALSGYDILFEWIFEACIYRLLCTEVVP